MNIKLLKVFGIEVTAHWSLLLILMYFTLFSVFGPYQVSLLIALAIFGIVLFHEFGHCLMGKAVGFKAEKINLNLFGGIAFVDNGNKPENIKWWKEFFVVGAGPIVNVFIMFLMSIVGTILGYNNIELMTQKGITNIEVINQIGSAEYIFYYVFILNIFILAFNMIPMYPLDGGQIMHSLIWGVLKLFKIKKARSLSGMFSSAIGLILSAGLLVFSVIMGHIFLAALSLLIGLAAFAHLGQYNNEYKSKKIS